MQQVVPHQLFDRLVLALSLVAIAVPVTYIEVARPTVEQIRSAVHDLGAPYRHTTTTPATAPAATPKTATPAPATTTPAATQPAAAATGDLTGKTATTNTLVHLRAGKSVDSANLINLDAGATVQLRNDSDTTWQGVRYNGKDGYIYRDYLAY